MTGTALFNLPILTVSGAGNHIGLLADLPLLTLQADGVGGGILSAEFNLPVLTLSAEGLTGEAGDAVFNLPILTLEAVGIDNGLGAAEFNLPVLILAANGATGGVGTAAFNLPILTLAASGLHSGFGTAAFNLPILFLDARGEAVLAAAYRTWVFNTRRSALTEYNNFNFNSYANFNGLVLACGPSGVVVLGAQNLDSATQIAALARTGLEEFGVSVHKRVPRAYLDGSQAGDLHVSAITVEGGSRTYNLPWNKISGHTQRRIPIGKGPRSRFWQFELANVDGADFSTTSLMVYPSKLRRRVS